MSQIEWYQNNLTFTTAVRIVLEVSQIEWYQNVPPAYPIADYVLEVSQIEWYQNANERLRIGK